MKIAIITCQRAFNYGAVLQTYALQKYLRNNGDDVYVIDYIPEYLRKSTNKNIILKIIRPILRWGDFKKSKKVFGEFLEKNTKLTKKYNSYSELKNNPPEVDAFIAGSDQIWNCNTNIGKDDAYFLGFVSKNKKKISYAASIAMDKIPEEQINRFKENLKDFDYISIREKTGVKLLENIGIKNVERVLDPVYLLDKSEWDQIAGKSSFKLCNEKYILVYGFKRQKDLYEYARKVANERNCKIYSINTNFEDYFLDVDKYFYNATPYDIVNLVKNAEEVITNSFHGLSFSIIYNKPVHQFKKMGNENSRMVDLLEELKMSERLVKDRLLDKEVNYGETNEIIKCNKNISSQFLKNSLGGE